MGSVSRLLRKHRFACPVACALLLPILPVTAIAQARLLESSGVETATASPAAAVLADDSAGLTNPADPAPLPDAPEPVLNLNPPAADQSTPPSADLPLQDQPHPRVIFTDIPRHFFFDELHIVSSPAYIRTRDLKWLLPLAVVTATSLETDHYTMSQVVSRNPSFNNDAITASDILRNSFIGVPIAFAGLGQVSHDDHLRESGILGGEGMIDAYVFDEVVKISSWRERPTVDNGRGRFFVGRAGTDSSFVSGHSVVAWSSAAVLAGEYPSAWHEVVIYTLATGVSLSRVLGQQHFPTDVLLGSAAGWLIGHYVFRAHHHALRGHGVIITH